MTKAESFSRLLIEHLGCDGELQRVGSESAGETVIHCTGCGQSIVHRSEVLDPEEISSPEPPHPEWLGLAKRLEGAPAERRPGLGAGHADSEREQEAPDKPSLRAEAEAPQDPGRPVESEAPPSGSGPSETAASDSSTRRLGGGVLARGVAVLALVVLVGIIVGAIVLLSGDPDGSERTTGGQGGGEANGATGSRELGSVTAEVPSDWTVARTPRLGDVAVRAPGGDAQIFVQTTPAEDGDDLNSLVEQAKTLLLELDEEIAIESEQVGPNRGRVVASEGPRKLRAMVRKDRGLDLISITDLRASADSEIRRQALELSQSIRAIKPG